MRDKAIIFFTRIPELGKIKTRLEPFLTKELCVELQTAFIKDIYNNIKTMGIDIIISYSSIGDLDTLRNIVDKDVRFIKQEGKDIGEKMHNAIAISLKQYKKVVLIGSDLPLLNKEDIELAFDILEEKDLVISPTYDGGYYLIGMKEENPDIFNIEYSTSSVFKETLDRIQNIGLTYGKGNIQLDIDDARDFISLHKVLKENESLSCENTRNIVNKVMGKCDEKKISIIIPVYNELTTINELMNNLEQFKDNCEIIFVDGGSNDGTNIIIEEKYRLIYSPNKGRSYQMNYGASLAKGEIFLFLHADSFLSTNALDEIYRIISQGYRVGCFKIKFDSKSIIMKICGLMSNLRVRLRNIAFGDQGIFIDRYYFNELGGFKEIPLMEDYQLSMDIKADKEKIRLAKTAIKTSERLFIKIGRLRTMARMQKLQYMYRNGEDVEVIAKLYKYY